MKTKYIISVISFVIFLPGCSNHTEPIDITPPASPRGLSAFVGDSEVELYWYDNTEPDLAGYRVYRSTTANGRYVHFATTSVPSFLDRWVNNGVTYYYAVSAYDLNGNESEISYYIIESTPRPEGYDVNLRDYRSFPDKSGYDFSTYSVGPYDDQYTDIFFENYNGVFYLNVWDDTDIQDMGYTKSLYEIVEAPTTGWSPTKDAQAIVGHTYVIWTWDNHFAKIRVKSVSSNRVIFDWAYQLQRGNTQLKRTVLEKRQPLKAGAGNQSRN